MPETAGQDSDNKISLFICHLPQQVLGKLGKLGFVTGGFRGFFQCGP